MKKVTLFLFTLLVGLLVIGGFNVKASSVVTLTDGAQVRTSGEYQGLRFQASVDTLEGTTEHGFFIALGEHSLTDMTTAIEAESATVGANKLVKKATTGADLQFAVVISDKLCSPRAKKNPCSVDPSNVSTLAWNLSP